MNDLIKKGLLVAVGISALTKERAEKLAKDTIKRGEITQKEGKAFVKKLISQSLREQQRFKKELGGQFKKSADAVILVTKNEINRLAARLKEYQKSSKVAKAKPMKKKKK